jgi:hypothetical protein
MDRPYIYKGEMTFPMKTSNFLVNLCTEVQGSKSSRVESNSAITVGWHLVTSTFWASVFLPPSNMRGFGKLQGDSLTLYFSTGLQIEIIQPTVREQGLVLVDWKKCFCSYPTDSTSATNEVLGKSSVKRLDYSLGWKWGWLNVGIPMGSSCMSAKGWMQS